MKINARGLAIVKKYEGCELRAYKDSVGVLTVGYGHTGPDVHDDMRITADQAEALLREDLAEAEEAVSRLITAPLTSNQFSALVSFTFNLGAKNLATSTLRRLVNLRDFAGAANQFLHWAHAGGKLLLGLQRRRQAERELFLRPDSV